MNPSTGLLVAAALLAGQIAGSPQAPYRVGTDLITVDVSVLDDARKPVRGLTSDDFTIFEDGKARPVVAFSSVDVRTADAPEVSGVASLAPWTRDVPRDVVANDLPAEGRLVVILLDRSIPAGGAVQAAREIAAAAVDELGPGDVAAVVRSSGFAGNGRVQGFTADRRLLRAAIDSIFTGMTSVELNPSFIPGQDPSTTDCRCGLCVFETISNVAAAMSEAPRRRKLLIFVGSAVTVPMPASVDVCEAVIEAPYARLMRALEMANVTVHSIDPSGVTPSSPRAAFIVPSDRGALGGPVPSAPPVRSVLSDAPRLDRLRAMPERTGGRMVASTNAPAAFVPAIFEESRSYYLLGFESEAAPDGAFHRIEVRVNRSGVSTRARSGYTLASESRAEGTAEASDLTRALRSQQPRQGLRLSASVVPFPLGEEDTTPVGVFLGAALPTGSGVRRVTMAVGAFDLRGRPVSVYTQAMDVRSPDGSGEVPASMMMRLDLRPGQYEIRAAVKDERTGAIGSVFSFVDVGGARDEPLALSGIVIGNPAWRAAPGSPLAELVPFVPTVARSFGPDQQVVAFLRVRERATPHPISMTAIVFDDRGEVRFQSASTIAAQGSGGRDATYTVALPLEPLPAGRYLLRIVGSSAERDAARQVRFDVRR